MSPPLFFDYLDYLDYLDFIDSLDSLEKPHEPPFAWRTKLQLPAPPQRGSAL